MRKQVEMTTAFMRTSMSRDANLTAKESALVNTSLTKPPQCLLMLATSFSPSITCKKENYQ